MAPSIAQKLKDHTPTMIVKKELKAATFPEDLGGEEALIHLELIKRPIAICVDHISCPKMEHLFILNLIYK